jgi:hypothetical protein
MPLTRTQVERAEVSRLRAFLEAAGLSTATDGTNPDLNEPMAATLNRFGVVPADRSAVTDDDLAPVGDTPYLQGLFLAWVELDALAACQFAILAKPEMQQWASYTEQWGTAKDAVAAALKAKTEAFRAAYLTGGTLRVGRLRDGGTHRLDTSGWFAGRRDRPRRVPPTNDY